MFSRLKNVYRKHKLEIIITCILGSMLMALLIKASVETIRPGIEGVRWHRFFSGTELEKTYTEGTHFIWPWDHMYLYNLRLQEFSSTFDVLAKNGVSVDVEVTFHYRPFPNNLPMLHKYIGPDYVRILILPKIGSHVRELFAQYEPEELFSVHRQLIEDTLLANIRAEIMDVNPQSSSNEKMQYVMFENIFITSMILPEKVVEAIEHKEATKQRAMAYKHRITIEEQEKIRKKLEAEGIRDFQNTINEGISEKYLVWKGIEATAKLADSKNAKIVVIGGGKDGLPIILGGEYTASQPVVDDEDEDAAFDPKPKVERQPAPANQGAEHPP
jgi:regulator of protease activity HflC (stomatin/prohibitin superfamily)